MNIKIAGFDIDTQFGDFMIAINKLYDDITIIYDFFGDEDDID